MAIVFPGASSLWPASPKTVGRHLWAALAALILIALALAGGYAALAVFESPGYVIRHELVAAGSAMERLPWSTPLDRVEERIAGQFVHHPASVDAHGFPAYVVVTLHGLDGDDCGAADRVARRIDGEVVIVAEGRAERDLCRESGVMTWRIMP